MYVVLELKSFDSKSLCDLKDTDLQSISICQADQTVYATQTSDFCTFTGTGHSRL